MPRPFEVWVENLLLPANLVPRAFPLKKGGAGKGPGIGWSRAQPKYSWAANLYATRWFCDDRSRTEQQWKIIIPRTVCRLYVNIFACRAIQKLKIHFIAYYSNATSLWKGVPAPRCHVQNMSHASELRQAVMSHCWLWNNWTIKREVI